MLKIAQVAAGGKLGAVAYISYYVSLCPILSNFPLLMQPCQWSISCILWWGGQSEFYGGAAWEAASSSCGRHCKSHWKSTRCLEKCTCVLMSSKSYILHCTVQCQLSWAPTPQGLGFFMPAWGWGRGSQTPPPTLAHPAASPHTKPGQQPPGPRPGYWPCPRPGHGLARVQTYPL